MAPVGGGACGGGHLHGVPEEGALPHPHEDQPLGRRGLNLPSGVGDGAGSVPEGGHAGASGRVPRQ